MFSAPTSCCRLSRSMPRCSSPPSSGSSRSSTVHAGTARSCRRKKERNQRETPSYAWGLISLAYAKCSSYMYTREEIRRLEGTAENGLSLVDPMKKKEQDPALQQEGRGPHQMQ